MKKLLMKKLISATLATMAGICLVVGVALLTTERRKSYGRT
jgi:nitrate reductase gamma subunit